MVLGRNKSFYLSQRLKCSVSTLPIRNGNPLAISLQTDSLSSVSTLPIRNGNKPYSLYCLIIGIHVSTLPIRNGNTTVPKFFILNLLNRKYLTYKEWKRNSLDISELPPCFPRKDLTYKEWKRAELRFRTWTSNR